MTSPSTSPDPRFQPNLYAALGLTTPSTATADDIKAAYRRIALEHHPDKHGGSESNVFIAAANAYQVLSNPQVKVKYDQWLRTYRATSEPHFSIDLDDMTAHCAHPHGSSSGDDDDVEWWTYPCRCEGEFRVDVADLEAGLTVFPCSGCTMRCRVVYYAIEEDEGEDVDVDEGQLGQGASGTAAGSASKAHGSGGRGDGE